MGNPAPTPDNRSLPESQLAVINLYFARKATGGDMGRGWGSIDGRMRDCDVGFEHFLRRSLFA